MITDLSKRGFGESEVSARLLHLSSVLSNQRSPSKEWEVCEEMSVWTLMERLLLVEIPIAFMVLEVGCLLG